jgi:hypothetical protein
MPRAATKKQIKFFARYNDDGVETVGLMRHLMSSFASKSRMLLQMFINNLEVGIMHQCNGEGPFSFSQAS